MSIGTKPLDIIDVLKLLLLEMKGVGTEFDYTINRDGTGNITSIVMVSTDYTKTLTFSRDGDNNIIGIDTEIT